MAVAVSTPAPCTCVAAHGPYVAAGVEASGRQVVAVFEAGAWRKPRVVLGGHHQQVTAVAFSSATGHLCTASTDHVLLWNIPRFVEDCRQGCIVVATDLTDDVAAVVFDPSTPRRLVVCCGGDGLVYESRDATAAPGLTALLRGHRGGTITHAAFMTGPSDEDLLVSVGTDRTAVVWDLTTQELLFQSSVLCAAPLLRVAVDPAFSRFVVAGGDGDVRVFEATGSTAAPGGRDVAAPRDAGLGAVATSVVTDRRPRGAGTASRTVLFCRVTHTVHVARDVGRVLRSAAEAAAAAAASRGPKVVERRLQWDAGAAGDGVRGDDSSGDDDSGAAHDVTPSVIWLRYVFGDLSAHSGGSTADAPPAPPPGFLPPGGDLAVSEAHRLRTEPKWLLVGTPSHVCLIDAWSYRMATAVPTATVCDQGLGIASTFGLWTGDAADAAAYAVVAASAVAPQLSVLPLSGVFPPLPSPTARRPPLGRGLSRGSLLVDPPVAPTGGAEGGDRGMHGDRGVARAGAGVSAGADLDTPHDAGPTFTAMYTGTLPTGSPLKAELRAKRPTSGTPRGGRRQGRGCGVAHHPVTFHTKIKSSGYGSVAPRALFGADRGGRRGRGSASARRSRGGASSGGGSGGGGIGGVAAPSYPLDAGPPTVVEPRATEALAGSPLHAGPITCVTVSRDGRHLASWSHADVKTTESIMVQRSGAPSSSRTGTKGTGLAVGGGRAPLLLTSSADRTAKMWSGGRSEPVLTFSGMNFGGGMANSGGPDAKKKPSVRRSSAGAGKVKPNPPFPADIRHCSFFFMDKFVLLTSASTLAVHMYSLDPFTDKSNDLRRLRNDSRYKLVRAFDMPYHTITAMACVNSFLSNLVLLAGSDRSVSVVDLAAGRVARTIADAAGRPVHTMAMPCASDAVGLPPDAYDLFLTSAQDDGVQLWDLRAVRPVRRFVGHTNRSLQLGACFSPCLRYIASGSEDRLVCLYDVGTGSCLHRLRGAKDAATSLCFNPRTPQLLAGCLDGTITTFGV